MTDTKGLSRPSLIRRSSKEDLYMVRRVKSFEYDEIVVRGVQSRAEEVSMGLHCVYRPVT